MNHDPERPPFQRTRRTTRASSFRPPGRPLRRHVRADAPPDRRARRIGSAAGLVDRLDRQHHRQHRRRRLRAHPSNLYTHIHARTHSHSHTHIHTHTHPPCAHGTNTRTPAAMSWRTRCPAHPRGRTIAQGTRSRLSSTKKDATVVTTEQVLAPPLHSRSPALTDAAA